MGCKTVKSTTDEPIKPRRFVSQLTFSPGSFVREQNKVTRMYDLNKKIGYGTYSSVILATHKKTRVPRAIKAISKKVLSSRVNT